MGQYTVFFRHPFQRGILSEDSFTLRYWFSMPIWGPNKWNLPNPIFLLPPLSEKLLKSWQEENGYISYFWISYMKLCHLFTNWYEIVDTYWQTWFMTLPQFGLVVFSVVSLYYILSLFILNMPQMRERI